MDPCLLRSMVATGCRAKQGCERSYLVTRQPTCDAATRDPGRQCRAPDNHPATCTHQASGTARARTRATKRRRRSRRSTAEAELRLIFHRDLDRQAGKVAGAPHLWVIRRLAPSQRHASGWGRWRGRQRRAALCNCGGGRCGSGTKRRFQMPLQVRELGVQAVMRRAVGVHEVAGGREMHRAAVDLQHDHAHVRRVMLVDVTANAHRVKAQGLDR